MRGGSQAGKGSLMEPRDVVRRLFLAGMGGTVALTLLRRVQDVSSGYFWRHNAARLHPAVRANRSCSGPESFARLNDISPNR